MKKQYQNNFKFLVDFDNYKLQNDNSIVKTMKIDIKLEDEKRKVKCLEEQIMKINKVNDENYHVDMITYKTLEEIVKTIMEEYTKENEQMKYELSNIKKVKKIMKKGKNRMMKLIEIIMVYNNFVLNCYRMKII